MSYLLRNNKKSGTGKIVRTATILAVVVLAAVVSLTSPAAAFFGRLFSPFASVRNGISAGGIFAATLFTSKYSLETERNRLSLENMSLKQEIASLEEQLLLSSTSPFLNEHNSIRNGLAAKVVLRPPYSPYDSLLAVYEPDGIRKPEVGDVAYAWPASFGALSDASTTPAAIPIGTVSEALSDSVRIKLFSAPGETLMFTVGTSTEAWTAEGQGGGVFEAKLPRSVVVDASSVIKLPEHGDMPYAAIADIEQTSAQPFEIVRFQLPVPFYSIERVIIGRP